MIACFNALHYAHRPATRPHPQCGGRATSRRFNALHYAHRPATSVATIPRRPIAEPVVSTRSITRTGPQPHLRRTVRLERKLAGRFKRAPLRAPACNCVRAQSVDACLELAEVSTRSITRTGLQQNNSDGLTPERVAGFNALHYAHRPATSKTNHVKLHRSDVLVRFNALHYAHRPATGIDKVHLVATRRRGFNAAPLRAPACNKQHYWREDIPSGIRFQRAPLRAPACNLHQDRYTCFGSALLFQRAPLRAPACNQRSSRGSATTLRFQRAPLRAPACNKPTKIV